MGDADDRNPGREGTRRKAVAETLARMERALASEVGEGETSQAKEYIEHQEFGLALELLTAVIVARRVEPDAYRAGVACAAERMGMAGPEDLSEWRGYLESKERGS